MKKYNVVIVGGGSHRNPDLMAMLASKKDVFPLKRVVLYDNEAERQEIMGQYGEILGNIILNWKNLFTLLILMLLLKM